mmetsp:Transcript_18894/g.37591  ORF Transcript_18894/g.37591 Transcript_18894/m.37591 type:complete len:91 (+) Transcript_18894:485-757(+)
MEHDRRRMERRDGIQIRHPRQLHHIHTSSPQENTRMHRERQRGGKNKKNQRLKGSSPLNSPKESVSLADSIKDDHCTLSGGSSEGKDRKG